jgi:hypothetical protein
VPDTEGNAKADEETIAGSPLHAYKEGREEDVKGDTEALQSSDPQKQQQENLEGDDELSLPHEKH